MCCSSRTPWLIALALGLVTALPGRAGAEDTARDTTGGPPRIISVIGGDTMRVVEISLDDDKLRIEGADGEKVTMHVDDLREIGSLQALLDQGNVVISDDGDSIRFQVGGVEKARFKKKSIVRIDTDGSDLVRVGESIEVEEGEVVEGDAVAVGGSARVAGTVMGDLVAIGGSVHLLPTADVRGEVVCVGGKITRDEGAEVGGEVVSVGPGFPWGHEREHRGGGLKTATMVFFMIGVFSGLAALIVYSIWGSKIEGMAALVPTETLRLGLIGLVAWLLAPWACFLLVITCVGVFFVPLFLVLLLFAIVAGLATIYLTAGTWGARGRFDVSSPVGTMLVGMVIVHGLSVFGAFIGGFIPILKPIGIAVFVFGLVVLGIAGTLGLGAVLYTRFGKRHMPATGTATPPTPPPFTAGATGPESVGV